MIKLAESDKSLSGKKLNITAPFGIDKAIKGLKSKESINFDSSFSETLETDKAALQNYQKSIEGGASKTDALNATMARASQAALNTANSWNVVGNSVDMGENSIEKFTLAQKQAEVGTMALDRSFANCKAIINEYNSGLSRNYHKPIFQN